MPTRVKNGHYLTTVLYEDLPPLSNGQCFRVLRLPYDNPNRSSWWRDCVRFWTVLWAALRARVMILDSTSGRWHPDLMAAVALNLVPRRWRPHLFMTGAMWQPDTGGWLWLERLLLWLAARTISAFIVQSSQELDDFYNLWRVPAGKVHLSLYFATFAADDVARTPSYDYGYVFAGGNAHRDYATLIEVARHMPAHTFVIAASYQPSAPLPPNVLIGTVSHTEFVDLMRFASVVVTPIQAGLKRAAGQQTYLNAMRFGKVTITNAAGVAAVHDHIRHEQNGLLVNGTVEDYLAALAWVFAADNREAVGRIGRAARRTVIQHFTYQHHIQRMIEIVNSVLAAANEATFAEALPGPIADT